MDTGVTSHLHADAGILTNTSNKSIFSSSVLVGDESSIPISNIDHSTFPHSNPYRTLVLNNVLIIPQIIKIAYLFIVLLVKINALLNLTLLIYKPNKF